MFASDFTNGLFIINVNNDANPKRISFFYPPDEMNFASVAKKDYHVYLASGTGIFVIDVSDLNIPVNVKKIDYNLVKSLQVKGNYLYVSASNAKGFTIYDINNSSEPIEKGSLEISSKAMVVSENYAYAVSNNEEGFNIIAISDPMNPSQKSYSALNAIHYYRDIFVSGKYVYAVGHGLNIVDVTDPLAPEIVGVNQGFSYCSSVKVFNDGAYLAHKDGISAVNISDKTNPVLAHELKLPTTYTGKMCTNNQKKIYLNQIYNGTYILRNDIPTKVNFRQLNSEFVLSQNYPNPFSKVTTIDCYLPKAGNVTLSVFDMSGKEIEILVYKFKTAGTHSIF